MSNPAAATHPDILLVERGKGDFSSRAVALRSFPPGAVFAKITGSSQTGTRTYATVQTGRNSDIDLNSDLVYCNHSCHPSVVFDMGRMEVRVVGERGLEKGEDVTFFYPSSEWDMAQPFECNCGAKECVGSIRGAKHLSDEILRRYWLNAHIEELLAEQRKAEGKPASGNGANGLQ